MLKWKNNNIKYKHFANVSNTFMWSAQMMKLFAIFLFINHQRSFEFASFSFTSCNFLGIFFCWTPVVRVTRCVCEKNRPKFTPNIFLSSLIHDVFSVQKNLGYFWNILAKINRRPIRSPWWQYATSFEHPFQTWSSFSLWLLVQRCYLVFLGHRDIGRK
jgi:hypothetical protein